jgi:hypothetical protein
MSVLGKHNIEVHLSAYSPAFARKGSDPTLANVQGMSLYLVLVLLRANRRSQSRTEQVALVAPLDS